MIFLCQKLIFSPCAVVIIRSASLWVWCTEHTLWQKWERLMCCQSKMPSAEKITLLEPLLTHRNESVVESYFFPICFCLSRLSTAEYQSLAAPDIIHRAVDQTHRLQELENTERNSIQRALQPRSTRAEGPGCFFFVLFLFKPGVILWVQFNIWEEGGIWIFIILW